MAGPVEVDKEAMAAENPGEAAQPPKENGLPDDHRTWSSRLLISVVVTFIVSGVGGALFQRYMARAKPSLAVMSVGFQGKSDELIAIPQSLISASRASKWKAPLNRYERFETLLARERHASETIEDLRVASYLAKDWMEHLPAGPTVDNKNMSGFTFFQNGSVGAILIGSIRFNDMPDPPQGLEQVQEQPLVGYLATVADGWFVRFDEVGGVFGYRTQARSQDIVDDDPDLERFDETQMAALQLLAESTASGVRDNLEFYLKFFRARAAEEQRALTEIREQLRQLVLYHSHLAVTVSMHNAGSSALILQPYFGLKLEGGHGDNMVFVLGAGLNSGALRLMSMPPREGRGAAALIEEFLPEASASPYLTASPGKAELVKFISVGKLQENGLKIRDLYKRGALRGTVVGVTLDGAKIWSPPAVFGQTLGEGEQETLNRILRGR